MYPRYERGVFGLALLARIAIGDDNIIWVSIDQHLELVQWWNDQSPSFK